MKTLNVILAALASLLVVVLLAGASVAGTRDRPSTSRRPG
jgi:hypothetical protein